MPAQACQPGLALQRKCACGSPGGSSGSCKSCDSKKRLQRKAAVVHEAALHDTAENAHFEAEADRVANEVLSTPSQASAQSAGRAPPGIQRLRSSGGHPGAGFTPEVSSALATPGQALDPATRGFFEPRFGHDFSRVRIHVDNAATRSVQAHAFTVGRQIVFASDRYRPGTGEGQRLLAHELTHVVQQSAAGSYGGQAGALQRDPDPEAGGDIKVIAKENGRVAVVLMRGGKIIQGYAEIQPPKGTTAAEAAMLIKTRVTAPGPLPKVDVIVPPDWGRQATNPAAKVEVKDSKQVEREDALKELQDARRKKVDRLRSLYRQYRADYQYQYEKFGDALPAYDSFGMDPVDSKSDEEILSLPGDNLFFEWMQRRQVTADWQDFRAKAIADGYNDADGIKNMWKQYRLPDLQGQQTTDKQLHDLQYDTEHALRQTYAKPLLLQWMASDPQPVAVPGDKSGSQIYVLPLPDGNVATLDAAQYRKLRQIARDDIETELNSIQNQKGLYQFHKNDRGWASRALDFTYGAELKGSSWGDVDDAVKAGRDALSKGDLKGSLSYIEDAARHGRVARREWNTYLHNREVGAEVTLEGLETVKTGSDLVLAVGTIPLGGTGLVIVTGKGVTESLAMATVRQASGDNVDWGDVTFDVGMQVTTALAMHGFSKLQALGPNNAIMQAFRESLGGQLAADTVQAVLVDSASHMAKQEYLAAGGRGEKFTAKDFMDHFKKYLSDPNGMAMDVIKAQIARHAGGMMESAHAGGEPPAAGEKPAVPERPGEKGAANGEGHPQASVPEHADAPAGKPVKEGDAPATESPPERGRQPVVQQLEAPKAIAVDTTGPASEQGNKGNGKPGPVEPESGKQLPSEQVEELRKLAADPEQVRPVTDPELIAKGYEQEISSGKRTYRRKKDGSWCRWASPAECGFKLDAVTEGLVAKSGDKHGPAPAEEKTPVPTGAASDPGAASKAAHGEPGSEAVMRNMGKDRRRKYVNEHFTDATNTDWTKSPETVALNEQGILVLKSEPGMIHNDVRRKASALDSASQSGAVRKVDQTPPRQTTKNTYDPEGPPVRLSRAYRNKLIDNVHTRAEAENWSTPRKFGAIRRILIMEGDHVIDLQLGGADSLNNIWVLDAYTNERLGAQIQAQLRNMPAGTRIQGVRGPQ